MGILIDTNVFIDYERNLIDLDSKLNSHIDEDFYISAITVSELLHGVWRAKNESIKNRRSVFVEAIIEQFPVLDMNTTVARIHSQIWAELLSKGQMIGPYDLWIAATALANDLTVITSNLKEFERVPGLSVESWRIDQ